MRAAGRRARLLTSLVAVSLGLGCVAPSLADEAGALAPNVVPLTVKTPLRGFNRMTVSLTVCAPGTTRCAKVDDVMVDTGSTGLRLDAAGLPTAIGLPPVLGAA